MKHPALHPAALLSAVEGLSASGGTFDACAKPAIFLISFHLRVIDFLINRVRLQKFLVGAHRVNLPVLQNNNKI